MDRIWEFLAQQEWWETVRLNLGWDDALLAYFSPAAWSSRIFLILCSLFYFYLIYRLGRRLPDDSDELRLHQNEPLWIPILKAFIFFLVLLPLVSFSVPVLVLETSYLIIFLTLFIILYPELSTFKRRMLIWIFIYYLILITANVVQSAFWWSRALSILINFSGILLLWGMGRRIDQENPVGYLPRYARWGIMAGHLISITLNLYGQLVPAQMWSLAAGIALLQALSLRSFRDMLLHDLQHQYERANPDAVFRRFNLQRMLKSADWVIRLCCGALIVLVLLNTLQLHREVGAFLERLLNREHEVGGISYTYSNLVMALIVILVANWLQKNLKNLVETPSENELQSRKTTLFPLFRLLIIIIGFLFAIRILGLGMDNLTIIIGALSVGIGLGLQNIINNFVSGIILVFEKPFKAGDYVELADKKGQVIQIGLRSSTLMTDEGARVIIPNSDFISGRMVNWTFSESDIRVNMLLKLETRTLAIGEIKQLVRQQLKTYKEVDLGIPIKVFTRQITKKQYTLSIQVGVENVRLIERFRSRFLEEIKKEMDDRQITVSSD